MSNPRVAIGAVMNQVAGNCAGARVFLEEPYAKTHAELLAQYRCDDGSFRGFFPRLVSRQRVNVAIGRDVLNLRWKLYGYWNMNPAQGTELAFLDVLEEIDEVARADETFGGAIATTTDEATGETGFVLEDQQPVMFAGVLCHAARMRLLTKIIVPTS